MRKVLILIFFLTIQVGLWAQMPEDSLALDSAAIDSLSKTEQKGFTMSKSPTGAIVRSLILPGWGQFYVENYWKAPLFFGGSASLVGIIMWNHDKYSTYQDDYDRMLINDPDNQNDIEILKRKKEFYRDQRDMSGFFLLGVYILAAVDSYVGAHLYDFPDSDSLSLLFAPGRLGQPCLMMQYRINP